MEDGEAEARLNAILRDYSEVLRSMIGARCRFNPELCPDELLQDARLRLWHALLNKGDIRCVRCYLHRLAAAVAIDALRRVKVRREVWIGGELEFEAEPRLESLRWADPHPSPEAVIECSELLTKVRAGLEDLSVNRRRAVELYLEGFSTGEIAARTGWHEAKARNLVYRGLAELRDRLPASAAKRVPTRTLSRNPSGTAPNPYRLADDGTTAPEL